MAVRSAKQRAALKKAQLASARKRRGHGRSPAHYVVRANNSSRKRRRNAAIAGVAVAGAVAGYAIHHHVKEGALKKKHGGDYLPKRGTYHHYTNNNSARKIAGSRNWKPTGKNGGHGANHGVWLTHSRPATKDFATRDVFGKARVSVRLSRKHVLKHSTHKGIPGGLRAGVTTKGVIHVQVHKDSLKGKRVRHNLPKTKTGTRRRAQGNRRRARGQNRQFKRHLRERNYSISRNMSVNPLRAKGKRTIKKYRRRR